MIKPSSDELILFKEIADPEMTRKGFAVTLSIMLSKPCVVGWESVNQAATRRWGADGLRWIHKEALKLKAADTERKQREGTASDDLGV